MRPPFVLCLVSGLGRAHEGTLFEIATAAASGGVDAIQVREKDLPGGALLELAGTIGEAVGDQALILINDRVDVAMAIAGAGVHLPGSGLPTAQARKQLGRGRVLGRSAHSLEEALAAERGGADYVAFGPVYETASKKSYGPPLGLARLREVEDALSIPVCAIGGITPERAAAIREAGAASMAVMSFILDHPDPERAAGELMRAWNG